MGTEVGLFFGRKSTFGAITAIITITSLFVAPVVIFQQRLSVTGLFCWCLWGLCGDRRHR